jgi:hypothetical protein
MVEKITKAMAMPDSDIVTNWVLFFREETEKTTPDRMSNGSPIQTLVPRDMIAARKLPRPHRIKTVLSTKDVTMAMIHFIF